MPEWITDPDEWITAAIVAVVAIVGIFVLLRITLGDARALRHVSLPAKQYRRVLLPTSADTGYPDEVVSLACRLAGGGSGGGGGHASVVLTYVIEVPRALAANAEMPEEEAAAQRVLDEAAASVKRSGLQAVTRIRKARAAVDETLRAIGEEKADLLVLIVPPGSPSSRANDPSPAATLTNELARRAPCEVVLARAAPA